MHTIIVPGVGGSDYDHWQSWLQRQLISCSRVQQKDWNNPVLNEWVGNFVDTIALVNTSVQVVAHSFGCLTTIAAIDQYPELSKKIEKLILVAPANPARFGENGFARDSVGHYADYFHQIKLTIPTELMISENDPWLNYQDALILAQAWNVRANNLGHVGHINVESGFGPFPELYDHLIAENSNHFIGNTDDTKLNYRFAI